MPGDTSFSDQTIRLGAFLINGQTRRVSLEGSVVDMQARTFALLWALVKNAPETLSLDAIKAQVWKGEISDDAVKQRVSTLRKALADDPRKPELIETVHGEGYRLAVMPEVMRDAPETSRSSVHKRSDIFRPEVLFAALILPLLAVFVFWWMPDSRQEYDGRLTVSYEIAGEENPRAAAIRTGILRELALLDPPIDLVAGDEATELLLSGRLVETGEGHAYQLDLVSGAQQRLIASFSADAAPDDGARVHAGVDHERDIAALRLAYMVWPFLDERLIGRADEGLASARRALAEYRLAFEYTYSASYDARGNELAIAHFQAAVAADPELANAHAFLADALVDRYERFASGIDADAARAIAAAREAIRLNPDLAMAHMSLGRALWLTGELAVAADSLDRSVQLQPGLRALRERYR